MSTTTDQPVWGDALVRDIMTTPVVTVRPDMPVKELVALFRERRLGGTPVVDDNDNLIGIVTEGDLMELDAEVPLPHYFELLDSIIYLGSRKKFEERLRKAAASTVGDLMTQAPLTVGPDDPARAAAALMSAHGFDRVPVEENGKVIGIVSRHDIMKILGL